MRTKKFKDRYHLFCHLLGMWYEAEKKIIRLSSLENKHLHYRCLDNKKDELEQLWKETPM